MNCKKKKKKKKRKEKEQQQAKEEEEKEKWVTVKPPKYENLKPKTENCAEGADCCVKNLIQLMAEQDKRDCAQAKEGECESHKIGLPLFKTKNCQPRNKTEEMTEEKVYKKKDEMAPNKLNITGNTLNL